MKTIADINNNEGARSEEVADIIERFPDGWTTIVSAIMAVISITTIVFGFVIQYPDTVSGHLSITGIKAPVRIVAGTAGRLHLILQNNSVVRKGDCIGYIDSGAEYSDIVTLDSLCMIPLHEKTIITFPDRMILGSLANTYNDFALAYIKYDQLRTTRIYNNMRCALANQKSSAMRILEGLRKKIALHKLVYVNAERQYHGDSILHASGAMSDEALEQKQGTLLASLKNPNRNATFVS